MTIRQQPLTVQTLFADLTRLVISAEAGRSIGDLAGHIVAKTVKGRKYWYLQFHELGHKKQVYLGPDGPVMHRMIASHAAKKSAGRDDTLLREDLCRMVVQGGGLTIDATSGRVMSALAGCGLFQAGAVLVGSHAFSAYGNRLGVRWASGTHTQDIDFAYDARLAVIFGDDRNINVGDVLNRVQMGFHPVPELNPKHPSTSFKMRGTELHIDVLTPLTGKNTEKPVYLKALGIAAQPLRYLDYLMADAEKTVILHGGGILANVPEPARYFWHKLIIMQERSSFWKIKIGKDKAQCLQLAEALLAQRPDEIGRAWKALGAKSPVWQKRAEKGISLIERDSAEIVGEIRRLM